MATFGTELGIAGWIFQRSIRSDQTLTLLDLPKVCRSLEVETIELVSTFFVSQNAQYLNQLRSAIAEQGLRVRSVAVDMGNLANLDEASRRTDVESLKQWFHVARAIGSEAIRVNSGAADPTDRPALARSIEGFRELAEEAAQTGVYLLIENHGGATADPRNVQEILEKVESPWFRTCPDSSNFTPDVWDEGMRIMAPRAFSCHVKVMSYSPDGQQRWTYRDGTARECNLNRFFEMLREAGYTGPICLEGGASGADLDNARDGLKYVRELLGQM